MASELSVKQFKDLLGICLSENGLVVQDLRQRPLHGRSFLADWIQGDGNWSRRQLYGAIRNLLTDAEFRQFDIELDRYQQFDFLYLLLISHKDFQ